jgi:hypothetical protein
MPAFESCRQLDLSPSWVDFQLSEALRADELIQGEQATVDTVIDLTLAPK